MSRIGYSAILVTQGRLKFYIAAIHSKVVGDCSFVITRREDPDEGFQRRLDPRRTNAIAKYIDEGMGSIPTAIILSAQEEAELTYRARTKTVSFNPVDKAFLIIDGQHRVGGFQKADAEIRVPVVIYEGLTRLQEAQLFIDINDSQEPVPQALLLDVKRLLESETADEAMCSELFQLFKSEKDSALLGILEVADADRGQLSRVHFNNSVLTLLRENLSQIPPEKAYAIINNYLVAIKGVFAKMDDALPAALSRPVVFRAVVAALPMAMNLALVRHNNKLTREAFLDVLGPLEDNLSPHRVARPGSSYKRLCEAIEEALSRGRHVRADVVTEG